MRGEARNDREDS